MVGKFWNYTKLKRWHIRVSSNELFVVITYCYFHFQASPKTYPEQDSFNCQKKKTR